MGELEFVTSEDLGPSRILRRPPESTRFTIGGAPDATYAFRELARLDTIEVQVQGDHFRVRALAGAKLELDGAAATECEVRAGQVLRLGALGLFVRHGIELASTQVSAPGASEPAGPIDDTVRSRALRPGSIVAGRYEVVARLAAGGMGEVYKVEHVELRRPFALKTMRMDLSGDADFVARFKREAMTCSRIGQQNIIDVSDFGQTEQGQFFFVMEFLDGATLASVIHAGAMPARRMTHLALQVARALSAAHDQGVIHRDLKPENIMVLQRPGQPDFVKVLDFGVAKVASAPGQEPKHGQTSVGTVVGTPQYMAPEQAVGQPATPRTDIYALGLLMHEMLSGRPVFTGDTVPDIIYRQLSTPPPPLGKGPFSDVSSELESLVLSMLAKNAAERPQSMELVIELLERAQSRAAGPTPSLRDSQATMDLLPAVQTPKLPPAPAPGPAAPTPLPELARPPRSMNPLVIGGLVVAIILMLAALFLREGTPPVPLTDTPAVPTPVAAAPAPAPAPAPTPAPEPAPVVAAPAPPPEPVAPARFSLELVTTPAGALVREGDKDLGKTPLKLEREAGAHTSVTLKLKGHQALTTELAFEGAPRREFTLVRAAAAAPDIKNPFDTPAAAPGGDLKDPFGGKTP